MNVLVGKNGGGENFTDGRPQTPTEDRTQDVPLYSTTGCSKEVMFVVDRSGSIKQGELNDIRQYLRDLVTLYQQGMQIQETRFGLATFAQNGSLDTQLTFSYPAILQGINSMTITNQTTNIVEGLSIARGHLAAVARPNVSKYIVLIVDGPNTGGDQPVRDLCAEIKNEGVQIIVVVVGTTVERNIVLNKYILNNVPGNPISSNGTALDSEIANLADILTPTHEVLIPCVITQNEVPPDTVPPPPPPPFKPRWLLPIPPEDVTRGVLQKTTKSLWGDTVYTLSDPQKCTLEADPNAAIAVSDGECGDCDTLALFEIAYGDLTGSGSVDLGGQDYLTVAKAVYGQFRNLTSEYPDEVQPFDFGEGNEQGIYVINVRRERMRDGIDLGTFELNIAHLSGSAYLSGGGEASEYTGSNVTLAGDDSVTSIVCGSRVYDPAYYSGRSPVYHLVSGSLELGVHNAEDPVVYGIINPLLGLVILSQDKMDSDCGFATVRQPDVPGDNPAKLLLALQGAGALTDPSGDIRGFKARSIKYEYVTMVHLKARHDELNLSNNPTYREKDTHTVIRDFYGHPQVFVTSVGLYNHNKELVAIGKISRPILRSGTDWTLFNVKITQ